MKPQKKAGTVDVDNAARVTTQSARSHCSLLEPHAHDTVSLNDAREQSHGEDQRSKTHKRGLPHHLCTHPHPDTRKRMIHPRPPP